MPFCILRFRACKPTRYAPGLVATRLPNPPRTLGEHLLVARFDRGLRQEDVARELGVGVFTLGNWEKGKTSPVIRHRPSIYRWLGFCPVEPRSASLGERLLRWRTEQGLSQHDIAKRLALDPATVHRLEQSVGTPTRRVRRAVESTLRARDGR